MFRNSVIRKGRSIVIEIEVVSQRDTMTRNDWRDLVLYIAKEGDVTDCRLARSCELLARVEANLRRRRSDTDAEATYSDGYVTVDFAQRAVKVGESALALTPLEFRMLAAFVRNANQVLSHEQLLVLAWGDARNVERDQVKLYVGYLRRKLGAPAGEESPIETVRGFGYRYRPPAVT